MNTMQRQLGGKSNFSCVTLHTLFENRRKRSHFHYGERSELMKNQSYRTISVVKWDIFRVIFQRCAYALFSVDDDDKIRRTFQKKNRDQ